ASAVAERGRQRRLPVERLAAGVVLRDRLGVRRRVQPDVQRRLLSEARPGGRRDAPAGGRSYCAVARWSCAHALASWNSAVTRLPSAVVTAVCASASSIWLPRPWA